MSNNILNFSYNHNFHSANLTAKKNTLYAMIITISMMIAEIIGGIYFNSMVLLADGWHMSSHALALGLAYFAYIMSNRYKSDARFNFGIDRFGASGKASDVVKKYHFTANDLKEYILSCVKELKEEN